MYGELIPLGGGDPIPLLRQSLRIGRRESCDIVLRFSNVSAHHCQLTVNAGYWYVRDLKSRNGIKVNAVRVNEKRIDSGDILHIAKHRYEVVYSPIELGAVGPPPADMADSDLFGKTLLERAGLDRQQAAKARVKRQPGEERRYDISDE